MAATKSVRTDDYSEEVNLVEGWLTLDRARLQAGALAGIFGAIVAAILGGIFASSRGFDFTFPVKLFGLIPMGPTATAAGSAGHLLAGIVTYGLICVFFGVVFAHFCRTNALGSLLAMGLVWAAFSWVFIWNLFLPAFRDIKTAQVSSAGAFFVCLAYGLSVGASVGTFDRILRGRSS